MKLNKINLFILAAIIMLANLFLLYRQSIRLDESQSIWVATKPLSAIIPYIAKDVHVPLYFILLHFWMQIFGTDITIIRLLSFIFFILSLPTIYIITKESSTKKIAILTIILIIFSPFIMWFTLEARMYTLLILITSINHFFFLRLYNGDGKNGKVEYVISAALGLYTHYFFIFFLASQAIYVLYEAIYIKKATFGKIFFFLLISAGMCFLPWVIYVLTQGGIANTQPLIGRPSTFNIFQTMVNFIFGFQKYNIQAVLVSLWPLLLILFFVVFTQKRQIKIHNIEYFLITTFLPVLLVFVISYIKPIFLPRYLIFITPTMFFILAWLLVNGTHKLSPLVTTTMLAVMILFLIYQNSSASTPVKEDYRDVVTYASKAATPQDLIVVTAPFTIYPIEYYYNGAARLTTMPEWNRYIEGPIPSYSVPTIQKQLKSYEGKYDRIFLILSYDQGYQDELVRYVENHYARLDKKEFPSTIELRVYKMRY